MASSSASTSTLLSASTATAWGESDDPNDWKGDYAFLKALDSSLRCEVCYDIFTAPVSLKDCGHTFCSACVRSAINQPDPHGHHCPKCMTKNVYDSSLVPQQGMEAVALQWRLARKKLYQKQQTEALEAKKAEREDSDVSTPRTSVKRRRSRELDSPPQEATSSRGDSRHRSSPPDERHTNGRVTRSRTRASSPRREQVIVFETDSEEDDSSYIPGADAARQSNGLQRQSKTKDYREMTANDLSPCPICQHTFTIIALNRHLDKGTCSPDDPQPSDKERGLSSTDMTPNGGMSSGGSGGATGESTAGGSSWFQKPLGMVGVKSTTDNMAKGYATRKRLTRPNYALTKDKDLRAKLEEHRLSTAGGREKLIERHRQWVNFYNANLDASAKVQKSDSTLRRELIEWERAQEEAAAQKSKHAAVSSSDKRAKAYAAANRDQFRELSERAKMSHLKNKEAHHGDAADKAGASEATKMVEEGQDSIRQHDKDPSKGREQSQAEDLAASASVSLEAAISP